MAISGALWASVPRRTLCSDWDSTVIKGTARVCREPSPSVHRPREWNGSQPRENSSTLSHLIHPVLSFCPDTIPGALSLPSRTRTFYFSHPVNGLTSGRGEMCETKSFFLSVILFFLNGFGSEESPGTESPSRSLKALVSFRGLEPASYNTDGTSHISVYKRWAR